MVKSPCGELRFKNLVEGLSDREVLQMAFECGYIPQGRLQQAIQSLYLPGWLKSSLSEVLLQLKSHSKGV